MMDASRALAAATGRYSDPRALAPPAINKPSAAGIGNPIDSIKTIANRIV